MKKIIMAMLAGVMTAGMVMANGTADKSSAAGKWPKKAVQMLVPSKAGGVTDIYTRNLQNYLQKATGGNFATVNYNAEAVAYQTLRAAKGDGNTLMFQHSTIICKYLTGAIDYNPSKEFRVVGEVADMGSQAIIVGPKAPYNTWEEFIDYCKKNPGKVICGITTNGATHFIFGQVQKTYGVKFTLVECQAEADKMTNIAGGNIDVANCSLGNARSYEKAGKIKVLGVLGSGKPEPDYPEWKPITDVLWSSHLYAFAPASIDDATATAINAAFKGVTEDPAYVKACSAIGGKAEWYDLATCQKDFNNTMTQLDEIASFLGIKAHK